MCDFACLDHSPLDITGLAMQTSILGLSRKHFQSITHSDCFRLIDQQHVIDCFKIYFQKLSALCFERHFAGSCEIPDYLKPGAKIKPFLVAFVAASHPNDCISLSPLNLHVNNFIAASQTFVDKLDTITDALIQSDGSFADSVAEEVSANFFQVSISAVSWF